MIADSRINTIIKKAGQKAMSSPYHGCATNTFTAIVDVIGLDYGDEVFRAMIGLAGGTGHLTKGTCGALIGAAGAISLSFNKSREETERIISENDQSKMHPLDPYVPKYYQDIFDKVGILGQKMSEKYGSILCSEIQFNLYGKTLNLLAPEKHYEFVQSLQSYPRNCFTVENDLAGWAVEEILKDQIL